MSVKRRKTLSINYSRVKSTDLMQHINWTLIHQDPIVSTLCIFHRDRELNPLRKWSTQSFIWSILRVLREQRKLTQPGVNWRKLDTLTRVCLILNKWFLPCPIGREITFLTDKQHWPISWEILSEAIVKQSWWLTFIACLPILKKRSQLWSSPPEWWR